MIFNAFALWSDTYDDSRCPEVMEKTYREAFRLHYGNADEGKYITVTHTTDRKHPYKSFVDGLFIEDEIYHLGRYKLTYTDGTEAFLDVKYGTNISNNALPCCWAEDAGFDPEANLDATSLGEICYSAIPEVRDGVTVYTTAYPNPHPDKTVKSFEYLSESDATVEVFEVRY